MSGDRLDALREALIELCTDTGSFIRNEMYTVGAADIAEKDRNSLVSYVDTRSEEMIVTRLRELIPEAGFITEEDTVENDIREYNWIVDPLDGTTNYLYKIPHFSTSIALSYKGEILLGIVFDIMQQTAYTAIKGKGAFEKDVPIHVSSIKDASKAIVATGFPYKREDKVERTMALLGHCVRQYRGFRRMGSAALDLAYVASGKIDIYYERSLNIWDLAAGELLVREAGGIVTDYKGGEDHLLKGQIVSANRYLHPGILDSIGKYLD